MCIRTCIKHCYSEKYVLFKLKRRSMILDKHFYPYFTNLTSGNQKYCHCLKPQNFDSYPCLLELNLCFWAVKLHWDILTRVNKFLLFRFFGWLIPVFLRYNRKQQIHKVAFDSQSWITITLKVPGGTGPGATTLR